MPRVSRAIAVGYPHHITQRGNYRQNVFSSEEDYERYIEILSKYAGKHDLAIWSYCLMTNHVHLVAVPGAEDSLASVFHTVHMLYAQCWNRNRRATGHLWQSRFFSCPMDERHVYAAVRYIENNPVRAGMVAAAEDYPWSSARSRINGTPDPLLNAHCFLTESVRDWREYLAEAADEEERSNLIKATKSGRPCGSEAFIAHMEETLKRNFTFP
ncbi:MAG: transposase, partial [Desulfobacterota bacterium]|nr:transposase [Thermodesulfobacteriota bacterium]